MSFLISIKLVNFAIFIFHITKTEESVNAKSFMWTTFFHEKLYNPPIRALIRWTENKSCQLSHATAIKSKNMNFFTATLGSYCTDYILLTTNPCGRWGWRRRSWPVRLWWSAVGQLSHRWPLPESWVLYFHWHSSYALSTINIDKIMYDIDT